MFTVASLLSISSENKLPQKLQGLGAAVFRSADGAYRGKSHSVTGTPKKHGHGGWLKKLLTEGGGAEPTLQKASL